MAVKKVMNHSEYMKKVKSFCMDALKYTIKDCKRAIDAMPQGINEGFYQDEIHYCAMELKSRQCKVTCLSFKN